MVSSPDLWDVARSLPDRLSAGESSKYLLFGWYKHGGLTGVATITQAIPGLVRLLNALLWQVHPTGTWTTLALFSSAVVAPHTDPRNLKPSYNYVLPLALPQGEHCLWVANPLDCPLEPWIWQSPSGKLYSGFCLPLTVGQPACVDPHSLHAMPGPIADSSHEDHVLLVGYSVPWLQEATAAQLQCLQDCGFQLPGSRGGAHPGGAEAEVHPGGVKVQVQERVFAAADVTQQVGEEGASEQGPLEWCMSIEGHQAFEKVIQEQKVSCVQGREPREHEQDYVGSADIHEDLQPDSFAEGSLGIGDAQRNRLQGRQFEVQDRNVVRGCLMHLNLAHLIGAVEQLGVEATEDSSCSSGKI